MAASEAMKAFEAGAGVSASSLHDGFLSLLIAFLLLWMAWLVAGVLEMLISGRLSKFHAVKAVLRAVVLVTVMAAILSR